MPSLYEELLEYERQKKAEQEASDERFAFSLMVSKHVQPAAGASARDEDEDEEDERGDDKEESREDEDEDEDEESWEEEEEGEEEEDDDDDYEVEPPPKRLRKASQRKSSATASAPGAGGLNVFSLAAYLSKNANDEEELENEPNQALKRAVERFAKASPPAKITVDPRVLDNPRPLWRKPLFLIEQVFNPGQDGLDVIREFNNHLQLGETAVFVNEGTEFGICSRRRCFPTNIHRIPPLSDAQQAPHAPRDIADIIKWPKDTPLPLWVKQVYKKDRLGAIFSKMLENWAGLSRDLAEPLRRHDGESLAFTKGYGEGADDKRRMHEIKRYSLMPHKDTGLPRVLTTAECERVMGFDPQHLNGFGNAECSQNNARKWIGESFLVPQVTHVLRGLRAMQVAGEFSRTGITVVSLFGGIGADAVALRRAGIEGIRHIVYVDIVQGKADVAKWAWKRYYGEATFHAYVMPIEKIRNEVFIEAVQLANDVVVIAGSPCNNISRLNRRTRELGFEGEKSSLFYQIPRILMAMVTAAMSRAGEAAAVPAPLG